MADLAQLEAALVKADAAGDTEGARILAGAVRQARSGAAPQQPTQPFVPSGEKSVAPELLSRAGRALSMAAGMTPIGGGLTKAAALGNEELGKAAYNLGGKVTDITGSPAAGYAANVGVEAIPMVLGGTLGARAAPAMRSAAESVMQSALKPNLKALQTGKGEAAVKTLLDEGVNVTAGGVEKLQGKVDVLNEQIARALKNSGAEVDKSQVASRIQDVIGRIEKTSLNPQDRIAEVQKVYDQVLANQIIPQKIAVEKAQQIKQGIYQMLRDKYGQIGSDTVEAQKALARGLKEEIATAVPEVKQLNAKESELLNALVLAQRRSLMSGNKNPAGLALLGRNTEFATAFLADRSELFKSIVARLLNANQRTIPGTIGAAAGASAGAYSGMAPAENR